MPEHSTVQPPLQYIPPRFDRGLYRVIAAIYPIYIRFALNVRRIDVDGIETLVEHYRLFGDRKIRLIIAFRHPHVDDGALMARLLGGVVHRAARSVGGRKGKRGRGFPPFAHFVYDRGVPLWAGPFIGWILQKTGGIPVYRGKVDSRGLTDIRSALVNSDKPLAIAPEGAVNYRERHTAPLDSGIAHFAFWSVRDLRAASRREDVVILPVAPAYTHGRDAGKRLLRIAAYLERECGISRPAAQPVSARLQAVAQSLLRTMERFYRQFYPATSAGIETGNAAGFPPLRSEAERIDALVEAALSAAERHLDLQSEGQPIARLRRVEQVSWDRIYREDIDSILSPLDRALADRIALETSIAMRHLQLADILVYLQEFKLSNESSVDQLAEAASNLAGVVARLKGGDISATPRMGSRTVTYRVGNPIRVGHRFADYSRSRHGAVKDLMQVVHDEMQRLSSLE